MAIRVTKKQVAQMPADMRKLIERSRNDATRDNVSDILKSNNDKTRIAEIRFLKAQIKRMLKRGEAVYVEHSAANGKMI